MCEVHLIESKRERCESICAACAYCEASISGPGIRVEGCLDDGSPGILEFFYHEDCALFMEYDQDEIAENDGCFSYGSPSRVIDGSIRGEQW